MVPAAAAAVVVVVAAAAAAVVVVVVVTAADVVPAATWLNFSTMVVARLSRPFVSRPRAMSMYLLNVL